MEWGKAAVATLAAIIIVAALVAGLELAGSRTTTSTTTVTATTTMYKTVTVSSARTLTETVEKTTTVTVTETKVVKLHASWPRVVIDALGRNVTIPAPPERVASLSPAITETLCVLHALDRLVAADKYSLTTLCVREYLEKHNKTVVNLGGYWWNTLSIERLVAAKPDLVLAEVSAHGKLLKTFEDYGLRVLYVEGGGAKTLNDVYRDIATIGYALGLEDRASAWIELMKRNVTRIQEKLLEAHAKPTPVLVILWWSPQGVWVPGGDTFIADVVKVAGGQLLTSSLSGWQQISLEKLASLAKGAKGEVVIIYTGMAGASKDQVLKTLRDIAGNSVIRSLFDRHVEICGLYGSTPNLVLRPGPFLAEGVELIASILHPNVFGERGGYVCITPASG